MPWIHKLTNNEDGREADLFHEVNRYFDMDGPDLATLGQALTVFDLATEASVSLEGFTGEWWESLDEDKKRSFISGSMMYRLIDINAVVRRYKEARELK